MGMLPGLQQSPAPLRTGSVTPALMHTSTLPCNCTSLQLLTDCAPKKGSSFAITDIHSRNIRAWRAPEVTTLNDFYRRLQLLIQSAVYKTDIRTGATAAPEERSTGGRRLQPTTLRCEMAKEVGPACGGRARTPPPHTRSYASASYAHTRGYSVESIESGP